MKIRLNIILIILVFLSQKSHAATNNKTRDTLYATDLKPFGRYDFNQQHELELISSAVHFGFKFKGEQCALYVSNKESNQHSYIQYELDGVYQKRLRVEGKPTGPIVIKAADNGTHTIWIYKATEATTGDIIISKIAASHIKPISVSKTAPLIEFIGNSITCGAESDTSDFACAAGEYHDHTNAYLAYGPRVARALGINYILSSVSGIGIYRTWNTEIPSMPQVYENIDFQDSNPVKWDFKKYSPKIVSIALGTNDMSHGNGLTPSQPFDPQIFISSFVNFIKLVKSKYPTARIALLSSPMINGASNELLEKCLLTIKDQVDAAYPSDKPIETFFFPQMVTHGCGGHPSIADHAILAEELQPFFQKLLPQ